MRRGGRPQQRRKVKDKCTGQAGGCGKKRQQLSRDQTKCSDSSDSSDCSDSSDSIDSRDSSDGSNSSEGSDSSDSSDGSC